MKILVALSAVLASLALGGAASASAAETASTGAGSPTSTAAAVTARAQLTGFECVKAVDTAARAVGVTAVMRPVTGTAHMQIRFELLVRTPGSGGYSQVNGAHLGVWLSPTPATLGQRRGDVWNVPDEVAELPAPATYKYRVSYRWIGRGGRVIASATKLSSLCSEPQLEPDLTASALSVNEMLLAPKDDRFSALIGNIGATAAGPFAVQLVYTHDGSTETAQKTIDRLKGHAFNGISFTGPLCDAGTAVTITVDPTDQIVVYSRSQASVTVTCPAPASSSAARARGSLSSVER